MAWISVHEGVDGPKLRKLYKKLGCSKFEAVGILNFLWFWGLSNADKDGYIPDVDCEDIERYLYGAGAGCKISPKAIVDALIATGWLDQSNNGMYIHDWEVWQEQWYKAKERRESDAKRKRESRKKTQSSVEFEAEETEGTGADETTDSPQDGPEESSSQKYTPEFEAFWEVYPRKIGKGDAYKKYKARRNDGYSPDELKGAAICYAQQCKKMKTDKQYIKHPKTFLSDSLPFLDFMPKNALPKTTSAPTDENPFSVWEENE